MRSAVALTLATSVSLLGCFPHSGRNRMIAEITEGALLAGGVIIESRVETAADCQTETTVPGTNCTNSGNVAGGIGLGMIVAGLLGFIATISSEEDAPTPPPIDIKATPAPVVAAPPAPPTPTPTPAAPPAPVATGSAG